MSEEILPSEEIKVIGPEDIRIPECCREGWASCPHVVKRIKQRKSNVGL